MEAVDPPQVAATLADLARQVDSVRTHAADAWGADAVARQTRVVARRAAALLGALQETLSDWYGFYAGYDPLFTWWAEAPYAKVDESLGGTGFEEFPDDGKLLQGAAQAEQVAR